MSTKLTGKITFLLLIVLLAGLYCMKNSLSAADSGTIDPTYKYAWSENAGWIDFGQADVADSQLTGYAYGENIGWISLNCANDNSCSVSDYGVANDGEGNLSGYAWSENVGWIDFNSQNSGVVIDKDGYFSGYAYAENIGWISFNCSNNSFCASVDYKIKTNWIPQSIRPACNNGQDDDGDGRIDYPSDPGCSSSDDGNELDSSSAFFSVKPNVSNITINVRNNFLNLENLPANISQIAISTTSDFKEVSWENLIRGREIKLDRPSAETVYLKFRTYQGAVSEIISYEINTSANPALLEGDIVKTSDNPDVYIIKYKNNKQYKRLILSPTVFNSYKHLKWENIKIIPKEDLERCITSNLVKEVHDSVIYELLADGDKGVRKPIDTTLPYDKDSVYEINEIDKDSYTLAN